MHPVATKPKTRTAEMTLVDGKHHINAGEAAKATSARRRSRTSMLLLHIRESADGGRRVRWKINGALREERLLERRIPGLLL